MVQTTRMQNGHAKDFKKMSTTICQNCNCNCTTMHFGHLKNTHLLTRINSIQQFGCYILVQLRLRNACRCCGHFFFGLFAFKMQTTNQDKTQEILDYYNAHIAEKNFVLEKPKFYMIKAEQEESEQDSKQAPVEKRVAKPRSSQHTYSKDDLVSLGNSEDRPKSYDADNIVSDKIEYSKLFLSTMKTKCFQYSGYLGLSVATVAASIAYYKTRTNFCISY